MTVTISDGTTSLAPLLVVGWSSTRQARNVIHDIIDVEGPEVTLRVANLRTGTLSLLCATLDDALELEELHAQDKVITFYDTDAVNLSMTYVANGSIQVEIDEETQDRWVVAVDFQQVLI